MKKISLLAILFTIVSCTTDRANRVAQTGCDCVEIVEYATSSDNFKVWMYVKTLPTNYPCSQNGYTFNTAQYDDNNVIPKITVRERHRVKCE